MENTVAHFMDLPALNSLSLDGAGYDSTQYAELLDAVDVSFFQKMRPFVHRIFSRLKENYPALDPDILIQHLSKQTESLDATLFFPVPHMELKLSAEDQRTLKRDWPNHFHKKEEGYGEDLGFGCYHIYGSTFSGHPTRTTLGNTLRSIFYYEFILHKAGLKINKDGTSLYRMLVSGDDVVMWIPPEYTLDVEDSIRKHTISSKDSPVSLGLGQIVECWSIKPWWDIDFCSKNSYLIEGKIKLTRDIKKSITTKLDYDTESPVSFSTWLTAITCSLIIETPYESHRRYLKHRAESNGIQIPESFSWWDESKWSYPATFTLSTELEETTWSNWFGIDLTSCLEVS